ncbi:MAG: hypothetical protein WCJ36_00895 [Candidatus Saccharibacteria bacterium]
MLLNKDIVQALQDKDMDRKTFLKYSGLAVLSLVGLKTVATLLTKSDDKKLLANNNEPSPRGFGSGKYGA